MCLKKVWKLREMLNVRIKGGASWVGSLFPFLSKVKEIFSKIESKFLNSRVLAAGFVMECTKSLGFKHI